MYIKGKCYVVSDRASGSINMLMAISIWGIQNEARDTDSESIISEMAIVIWDFSEMMSRKDLDNTITIFKMLRI